MTSPALTVAVLISTGRHPVSGVARACRGDAVAMAVGRQIAGDALRVVHAGRADDPSLAGYLAFGAGNIDVVPVPSGADVVPSLAAELAGADLILTGCRAETGLGSGLLPYALADALSRPIVANAVDLRLSGRELRIGQYLPKGKRRTLELSLPAVVAIHPLAPARLGYAYARRSNGFVNVLEAPSALPSDALDTWTLSPAGRQLQRLKCEDKKSAHARLNAAIAAETKRGMVVTEGSDADKAEVLLAYLREHRLIDF